MGKGTGNGYSWKITLKKVGVKALIVLLAGLAATYGNNPYYLAVLPLFEGLSNYLKHRND